MRALCGAIITAGALVGLGLFAVGIGYRYSGLTYLDLEGTPQFVKLKYIDTALMVSLVALLCVLAIGLGIAFLGLAYHHHRRHMEMLHRHNQALANQQRNPGDRPPSERITV